MPYEWSEASHDGMAKLTLRPHRSLHASGFVTFIAATALMLFLPLLALLGTALLWGILPFVLLAVGGVWWALRRNTRDAALTEELTLTTESITLIRRAPDGTEKRWQANPYWVSVQVYPTGGPVPAYLTLKGDGREVELGAFLSEEERRRLADDLRQRLVQLR
ncbi:MAG: DUF2244 domain-containing protein [Albidovulum sp.]